MINRENLIRKFNPVLTKTAIDSPLSVGNGDFAFTADVTGLQTLYEEYKDACPLLTMAGWAWHSAPNDEGSFYGKESISMTEYLRDGRLFKYPVKCFKNEEKAYNWLRQNPHRFNLMKLGFKFDGRGITSGDISEISQSLDLYTGVLTSSFKLQGKKVLVKTIAGSGATIAVNVQSELLKEGLTVEAVFPYGSPDKTASDFVATNKHSTFLKENKREKGVSSVLLLRVMDEMAFYVRICGDAVVNQTLSHSVELQKSNSRKKEMNFCISFGRNTEELKDDGFKKEVERSEKRFYALWNKGAMIDVTTSLDKRAYELQRRIILSMYLSLIQCTGNFPPQETGLTCNSWYGRFHLEMHPIHSAYLALYGRGDLLEKSFDFYLKSLWEAKLIASSNGFKGARWPKMTSPAADQAPSEIAPLLIWQQPHILYMIELLRQARYSSKRVEVPRIPEKEFINKYKDLIVETADFMADFAEYDEKNDRYVLKPPIYSVQEKGNPEEIFNPPFELRYWSFGLEIAYRLMGKLGIEKEEWKRTALLMTKAPVENGLLCAYEGCHDTYEKLNIDHPSMLFAAGFISDDVDKKTVIDSLKKFEECWDYDTLWGWDFAFLAMTYAKFGMYDEAFDMLLAETEKNRYAVSGNNVQGTRKDLPLYLPGNGALLLAMSAMKSTEKWYVETEGIMEYPF